MRPRREASAPLLPGCSMFNGKPREAATGRKDFHSEAPMSDICQGSISSLVKRYRLTDRLESSASSPRRENCCHSGAWHHTDDGHIDSTSSHWLGKDLTRLRPPSPRLETRSPITYGNPHCDACRGGGSRGGEGVRPRVHHVRSGSSNRNCRWSAEWNGEPGQPPWK